MLAAQLAHSTMLRLVSKRRILHSFGVLPRQPVQTGTPPRRFLIQLASTLSTAIDEPQQRQKRIRRPTTIAATPDICSWSNDSCSRWRSAWTFSSSLPFRATTTCRTQQSRCFSTDASKDGDGVSASDETTPPPPDAATDRDTADASNSDDQQPVTQYSTEELTRDAAKHKASLNDPTRPDWQNPLHHNNPANKQIFREDFESQEAFDAAVLPAPPISDDVLGAATPDYVKAMGEEILHLTVLEMNELVNKIGDHYGFHEDLLSPERGGMEDAMDEDGDEEGADSAAAAAAEKTSFDLKLVEFDSKTKLKVIKEVRSLAGLGLKDAKELVESAPKTIMQGLKKEQAEEIQAKLQELGAVVELV